MMLQAQGSRPHPALIFTLKVEMIYSRVLAAGVEGIGPGERPDLLELSRA